MIRAPSLYVSTRRELLTALLGVPLATSCRGRTPEVRFDGGFVDRVIDHGHRLREPLALASEQEPRRVRVLVLGAGVAGLTAAWLLARAKLDDYLVLELEDRPGGTSMSGASKVTAFPWGAHYLPAPFPDQRALLELLSEARVVIGEDDRGEPIFDESQLCAAPRERIFFRGLWHEGLLPESALTERDQQQLAAFQARIAELVAWRDREQRRAFVLPLAQASADEEVLRLDRLSMAEWLKDQRLDAPILRWWVEYAARDDFGAELEDVSAYHALHYFAARVRAPGDQSAEFLTWPAGNGHLVEHLVSRIGDRISSGQLIASVKHEDEGRRVRVQTVEVKSGRVRSYSAERVIFALPSFLRARVLGDGGAPEYTPRYTPWLVANIHLRETPRSYGYPIAWDNVVYGSRSLGYVVATHQTPRSTATGRTVWTHYLPFTRTDERAERRALASLSWKEVADAIVTELSSCHERFVEHVERIDVMRWGHGMVRPLVGTATSPSRRSRTQPFGRIHFAHTDLSGVALFEEAFDHGARAAGEVLAALSG